MDGFFGARLLLNAGIGGLLRVDYLVGSSNRCPELSIYSVKSRDTRYDHEESPRDERALVRKVRYVRRSHSDMEKACKEYDVSPSADDQSFYR